MAPQFGQNAASDATAVPHFEQCGMVCLALHPKNFGRLSNAARRSKINWNVLRDWVESPAPGQPNCLAKLMR